MNRIEGQTVLVTGASSGIGEGGSEVLTFGLDVRDRSAVEAFRDDVASAGAMPGVLVNNAGKALGLDPLQEGDPDDWDEMIDTNVKGLLYATPC